jgi:Ran GTPase-activating protein (RanGAP) involved in mRNA processing and transport
VLDRIFNENDKCFEKIPKIINGIDLYGEQVTLRSLEVLFKGLMKWENNIIKLDLDSCKIADDASLLIANFLRSSKKLSILLLRKNLISDVGIKAISEGVMEDSSLIDFDIAFNKLGNEGCVYIADVLNKAKKLKKLFISGNNISYEGIQALYDSIQKHTTLYYISLINNHINENSTLKLLFDAVMESKVIQKLNIGYNKFEIEQAELISEFISKDFKLKKLFLFQLYLNTQNSVKKLSDSLKINKTIEYLNLKDSKFNKSFKNFPEFLQFNRTVLRLNLYNNHLEDKDIKILVTCMYNNTCLEVLNLGYNNISEEGAIDLAGLIESNQILKDLDLSFNKLGSEGADTLFKSLKKNKTLLFLNLKNNLVNRKSLLELLKILKNNNHSIEFINLKRNEIKVEKKEIDKIREMLNVNKKIKFLGLTHDDTMTEGFDKLFLKNVLRDNLLKNKYDLY